MPKHIKQPPVPTSHDGVGYIELIKLIADTVVPRTYLEIGMAGGASLSVVRADCISVDPGFAITTDVLSQRKRSLFFRMPSDEFFRDYNPQQLLGDQIDLAFLDGMHRLEFLLRDFINTERACHARSTIFLHDCLPTNTLMAGRVQLPNHAWTGDVWPLLPILKKYRPDLRVRCADCPPTGLVIVDNLDPQSQIFIGELSQNNGVIF